MKIKYIWEVYIKRREILEESLIGIINVYGYIGIMFLILIENIFPPIPSEVVLLFGGYLIAQTDMKALLVILSATVGAILGAVILYYLGYILKREKLRKLFSGKFGRVMHLKPEYIDLSYKWFLKYEKKAVLICRCIPVARSLISIPAGISKMKFSSFMILSIIGTLVWNSILVGLGNIMGEAWEACLPYLKGYSEVVSIGGITLGIIYVMMYKKRKKKKKGSLEYIQNEKEDISKENIYLKERDMDDDIYLKGEDL